jgi:uncharacterized protein YodC (DUF2158 family)
MTLTAFPQKEAPPFEEGDCVVLKAGGQIMVVNSCRKEKNTWFVECEWHDDKGSPYGVEYKAKLLVLELPQTLSSDG